MKLQSLFSCASLFFVLFSCNAQTTISGFVNEYTPVLGFFDCDKSLLQVGSTAGFSAGDEVLIIQMQGAAVNTSNTVNFGNITNAGNAGNFELNRIQSITGNQIKLLYKPLKTYDVAGKVQLVRVPEYDNVSASNLTCKAWDGTTGGVLIIDVSETLTLQGGADVSAKGFRGGVVSDGNVSNYHETDYFYSPIPDLAAAKGEGIAIISTNLSYGRGKVANGGGGGNAHNAGGGGGGNAGAGGNGGLEYWFAPNSPTPGTNGIGGLKVFDNDGQRITLGGGGGAGHANDLVGTSGGTGGGIIILKSNNIIVSGANVKLTANGANVVTSGDGNNDGQGGGGAGGSILIEANQVSGALNCELKGGNGADCLFYVQEQIIGPGGGGGGGKLMLSQSFPSVTSNLDGGLNGIANQNQTNGAQPGQPGIILTGTSITEDTLPAGVITIEQNISFCPGSSVTINGITYTEPGTVVDTIPGIVGCDTVLTYNLQYSPVDLVFHVDDFICNKGKIDMTYTLCNLGSGGFPPIIRVTFFDSNPLTGPSNNLEVLTTGFFNVDSCVTSTLTNFASSLFPFFADGAKIYYVVNFDGSLPTPFSFDDFPVTTLEECNYTNNLDSFIVQLPSSPTLDLGPDVVLCVDSTVVFDAGGGFFSYLWQDGSTAQTFAATNSDIYWVEVTDSCGFKQRDSVLLSVSLLPDTQFPDMEICAGESVSLSLPGFDTYAWSPATGLSCTDCADVTISPAATTTYTLLATTTDGCILEDTFTVIVLPIITVAETIEFCPGESVTIDGVVYTQSGTVIDTTTGPNGCDLITTYTLMLLTQPVRNETVEFCKGDTVFIGGTAYTQPGTVVDTIPAQTGCDTIATYNLQYLSDPNASVSIDCVSNIDIATQPGTGPIVVNYDLPTTAGNCPCPGIELVLTQGLPSGSLFPVTTTKVCYQAKDSCGNTASCCFNVTIREEQPCDIKQIGCMKYELLDIKRNASDLNLSYRIRVTNACPNKMIYTAIQIPDGMVAVEPANNAVYVTPNGRDYDVRNPNYSPFYSIRFKSQADSIANGESDIFEYTLPPQINPAYIHITARLYPQIFYEAHLNTFNCPIEITNDKPGERTYGINARHSTNLRIFPNPTSGALFADLSDWQGERVQARVFDSRGQHVEQITLTASDLPQEIQLPDGLPNGLYFLEILDQNGEKQTTRFIVQR